MSNNNKTPAIRFKGFTDTWEQREFDKVFLSFPNKNYQLQSTEYYESGKFPIIDQGKKAIIGYSDNKSKVCNKYPSIIFGDHTTELKYVDFPFIIGADGVKTLSVKDGDTLFQYYNLQVNNVQPTGYNRHFSMLKEISLCVPCLAEQRQIGAYFRNLDTLITLHQRKCDKLIQFKAAMLQKMFPQNGADKPEIRFKGFTDAWEQREVGEWGNFYYGHSCPKWSVTEDATTPCIRYGEMYTKFGCKIDRVYSYTNIPKENLKFSKGTEVLVPRVGEDPMDYNHCTWLSLANVAIGEMISVYNTEQNPLFTAIMFNATLKYEFAKRVEGGSVTNLYYEKLLEIPVSFPNIEEQKKIASLFENFDNLITLHQRKCDKYKSIKAGLIRKLFP